MTKRQELEQALAALEAQRATLGDAVVDPLITAARKELAALEPPPSPGQQRKQVSVLFADVSGFTAMSETMDAEDVTEVMNAMWQRLDGAIVDHGGTIDKHMGDGVMAIWGGEMAREDDPERAIRAALAMQEKLAAFREEQRLELAMRIGLNTGPVLLSEVGTLGEYTAMGDTVNLASRLEQAAPIGGVLISQNTYRHVRGVFDVQSQRPLTVKGRTTPVQTYVVERAKPRAFRKGMRGIEGVETRLVGREGELKRLQDTLSLAIEDCKRRMVSIVGEAGVGKSRILYEFEDWLELHPEQIYYFEGRGRQETKNAPYALIRDLFSFRFQIQDSDPGQTVWEKLEQGIAEVLGEGIQAQMRAHFLGQLLGFDFADSPHLQGVLDDAKQLRDRALIYIRDYFKAVAAQNPAVVLLEDLHWADESSLDLLNHLVLMLPEQRLLIVCTARPGLFARRPHWGEGQPFHTRLELRPLSKRDSRRLVEEILQKLPTVPEVLRELIVSKAEGNPFYVEELIKMLIEDGVIVMGIEWWQVDPTRLTEIRVPPTLTGVLQARLDRLPQETRTSLQCAAVVGRTFWDDTVAYLGGETVEQVPQDQARISTARLDLHALYKAGLRLLLDRLGREHPSYSDALILQQRLVENVIQARRYGPTESRRAERFEIVDRLNDLAMTALEESFNELCAQGAGETGPTRGLREQDLPSTPEALATLHERELIFRREASPFAETQEYIFKHAILHEVTYESVLKRLRREYHALVAEWLVKHVGARTGEYTGLIADHLDLAGQTGRAATYLRQAGEQAAARFANEEAVSYFSRALALTPETDVVARYDLLLAREKVYDLQGEREAQRQAIAVLKELAEALDEDRRRAEVALRLALYCEQTGDYAASVAAAQEAIRLAQTDMAGDPEAARLQATGCLQWGRGLWHQGNYEAALTQLEQALALAQSQQLHQVEADSLRGLGTVYLDQGDYGEARSFFEQALRTCRETGDRRAEGRALNSLGIIFDFSGDYAEASAYYGQALDNCREIGNRQGESLALLNLGVVCEAKGNYAKARAYYQEALQICREIDDRWSEGILLNNLGILPLRYGDYVRAKGHFEQALLAFRQIGSRRDEGVVLTNLGLLAHHLGDDQSAREYAQQALHITQELGDRPTEGEALTNLGHALTALGQLTRAVDAYQQAVTVQHELGQHSLAMEALAGLACVALAREDLAEAQNHVEEILTCLENNTLDGTQEPFRIYLTCYRVLQANHDSRAQVLLNTAHRLLQEKADRIGDEEMRRSFLENVAVHREIVDAWRQAGAEREV